MPSSKTPLQRPAQRPDLPALPPFETLDATHRQVLRSIDQLLRVVEQLGAEAVDEATRKQVAAICQFLDDTARAHHAVEEASVFPALLQSGDDALVQHVQRLQQDHGWLEQDWLELQPQLKAVAEGMSWYDPDYLRVAMPIFAKLYRDHIALEESIVYPASQRLRG